MASTTTGTLSLADARRLRARAQRLAGREGEADEGVAVVVAAVVGVQAQDRRAAALSVRARRPLFSRAAPRPSSRSGSSALRAAGPIEVDQQSRRSRRLVAGDVERAQLADRSVVRTWAMRGTFRLVAADDVRWLLALLDPVFVAAGRRRLAELGLDDDRCARGVALIRQALAPHGTRTRGELADDLRAGGLPVEPGSRAVVHLVRRAALEGLLCVGPERDGDEAYVLLDDWVPVGRRPATDDPDTSLAELGRRYLAAYGPAGPDDLAAWSGLAVSTARRAWTHLEGDLTEVWVEGTPAWVLAGTDVAVGGDRSPSVRLLPAFDTYLLGYRTRRSQVDDRHARRVRPGGGWIHPTVVVDGQVVATWRLSGNEVVVDPFDPLDPSALGPLRQEAADVGRFLGVPTSLVVEAANR